VRARVYLLLKKNAQAVRRSVARKILPIPLSFYFVDSSVNKEEDGDIVGGAILFIYVFHHFRLPLPCYRYLYKVER
jgi:hypothetical protein